MQTATAASDAERISRVIFQHAARISQAADADSLLILNADLARDLVGADRCSVWLIDPAAGELWTKVAHGAGALRIPAGHGVVGACIQANAAVLVNDAARDSRFNFQTDAASGYHTHSILAVPLRAEGAVIGVLQALNKPGGFSASDVELLGLAGSYAAAAIEGQRLRGEAETARLFYHELEIARDVQSKLLPQDLRPVAGVEYTGFCRPAKFVGGDYYDFLELPSGLFVFTLGDVSGKGISAAVLMANIQALLRSHLLAAPLPLSNVLNALNRAVFRSSTPDRYTTLFCGVLNAERNRLIYANAGQVAPMVARARGEHVILERPEVGGFPVGLIDSAEYEQGEMELAPGDVVVCFSDGISEAATATGELWDDSGVAEILRRRRAEPVERIVESIVAAADRFAAGAEQADDMTVIAIRAL